jgi:hypothetical protein
MNKLKPKQFWWLFGSSFFLALLGASFAVYLRLWDAFIGLFRLDVEINGLIVLKTFGFWLCSLWVLLAALGYVGIRVARLVRN